jgi:TatD DNase family protein
VSAILTAGTNVATSRAAVALAHKYTIVYAAVGIHPHEARSFSARALDEIRALAREHKIVAIGEIGLDFHYPDNAPRDLQERNFVVQLDLGSVKI